MRGWHHGYLGIFFLIAGFYFNITWMIVTGIVLVIDELTQILFFGHYGGLIHWIYIRTLYKIKWIREFNKWLDRLFGN